MMCCAVQAQSLGDCEAAQALLAQNPSGKNPCYADNGSNSGCKTKAKVSLFLVLDPQSALSGSSLLRSAMRKTALAATQTYSCVPVAILIRSLFDKSLFAGGQLRDQNVPEPRWQRDQN